MCQSNSYRGATGAVCNEGGDENDEDGGGGGSEEDTLHRSKREIVKLENFSEVESKRGDLVFFNYFAIVGVVTSKGGSEGGKERFFRGGTY